MAESISDGAVVAVLRPFVRVTRPLLRGLRETDPFGLRARVGKQPAKTAGGGDARDIGDAGDDRDTGDERGVREKVLDLLAAAQVPGTAAWASMGPAERSHWWVRRVGRFTTLVAAVPGIGGAVVNRLPVSAVLGAVGQGLLLVAIAGEHGVHDEDRLVGLLGRVLFRRELVVEAPTAAADRAADARAAELTGDLADSRPTLQRVASVVWRLGRALWAVEGELDKRPHGNWFHSALGNLPVVGAVGKYLGEWSGLQRAAREAEKLLGVT
ncbi:hypothetical protein [Pseudonocardia broussonetiae]|uniref:Uncharacterized protein n=1 Tax=Pseudonocardia broussonetiae TaxID=2736640 RepID=A0A6M6JAR9_9PSEU|nr:hypothetical protein [Pseudonocardia broussonetiae]QJY44964.1 hypothetical protein HOP40_03210 [Pseudonocardia broussonetiae]